MFYNIRDLQQINQSVTKKFQKKCRHSLPLWNKVVPLHPQSGDEAPLSQRELPQPKPEGKFLKKNFRKNLEVKRKTPYLCNRFPKKNGKLNQVL